jgi:hypothetical protein
MVKKNCALASLILVFGVYLIVNRPDQVECLNRIDTADIGLELINNNVNEIPDVKPINYFEKNKNFLNWHVRSEEENAVILSISEKNVTQGKYSMKVCWNNPGSVDMLFFHFPQDWNRYKRFVFEVYSENKEKCDIEVSVADNCSMACGDHKKTRYSRKMSLNPGMNRLVLRVRDIRRKINLTSIHKIIYLRFYDEKQVFYIDNMRLES